MPASSSLESTFLPIGEASRSGLLIVNADDWGRDCDNTGRIRDCVHRGTVSSVSAMVFMEDSERAATMAGEESIDAGLHLNFTTTFSDPHCPAKLVEHQRRVASYLRSHPLARVMFHPGLAGSFKYIVAAQIAEYRRLYQAEPQRLDGHHHMHLSANVLWQHLLPEGTVVRRNFSFEADEKGAVNRFYRKSVDRSLARRHRLTDFFFSLAPLEPESRLQRILSLASECAVEVETHPVNPEEYRFLTGAEVVRWTEHRPIARGFALRRA